MKRSALVLALLLLQTPLSPGTTSAYGAEPEKAPNWVKVTEKAEWQPRDSSGELVFRDQLWLFGGWFTSHVATPRDVWSSSDGKSWKLVSDKAPWLHGDLPMSVVFKDKMWFLGGWYNGRLTDHSASNEVWSTSDGLQWQLVTPKAGWTPRIAAGTVVFKDRIWMLGGLEDYYFGDDSNLRNDVWSSADGKQWKLETMHAGWSPRAYHQAVVHDGKMWVMGGGNYVPTYHGLNDVWCSEDGVHWTQVTAAAPWHERLWFSSVVYRDRMWVLGGWSKVPTQNWGDVWYSKDGKDWKELKSDVIWKARHEHSAYVFKDKIWVAGGHAMPLSNEVWSLDVPPEWFK